MSRRLRAVTFFFIMLLGATVALFLLRNHQMDVGVRAYKEDNGALALRKLKPIAYFGDKTAQMLVGSIYAYGLGGIPKSDQDAIYWFRRCGPIGALPADGSDPVAPLALGVAKVYAEGGDGVKPDSAESAKWLRIAAKGGSKEAAAILAKQPPR